MTPEIISQIGEGNVEGFQKAAETMSQQILQTSQAMTMDLLSEFGTRFYDAIKRDFEGTLEKKDTNDFLVQQFPSAKNANFRPFVQSTFDQAMILHKGNRERAIAATKQMLRDFAEGAADDIDYRPTEKQATANMNWVDLLGTKK